MKYWLKKNKDTIVIVGVSTIATSLVVGVTYKVTKTIIVNDYLQGNRLMSLVASDAGVLDKIIEHQEKLKGIHP